MDKIPKANLDKLFWLSLTDPTSAENSGVDLDLDTKTKLITAELKKIRKHFRISRHNIPQFIKTQFYGGRSCK